MDPCIESLKSTTFFSGCFTLQQIADIQQTVATFPALSRKELAQTICEHLHWHTPVGDNRVAAGLGLLEALEQVGILTLPLKRPAKRRPGPRERLVPTWHSAPQPAIEAGLGELTPLRLQLVEREEEIGLWNEFVAPHHSLGYSQPLGPHQGPRGRRA